MRYYTFILLCALVLSLNVQPVYGLRCDGRIVQIGDKTSQVANKFGQPDHIDYSQEERVRTNYYSRHSPSKEYRHLPFIAKETIQIEEWTYNFGPTKFICYLSFENERLTKIELGDKGYYHFSCAQFSRCSIHT